MTVQELIDELNKIDNKSKDIYYPDYFADGEHVLIENVKDDFWCINIGG